MQGPAHFIIAAGVTNDPSIPKVKDDLRIVLEYFTQKLEYQHALPELADSPALERFRCSLSNWFAAPERHPEDRIVLYFSGHGEIGKDGRHYLILVDSSPDRPSGTGFATATLASIPFETGRVKQLLVVLDTCFSGTGLADAASWASQVQADTGCLLQLISSARKKDFAKDGVFAPHFIEAISNQGDVLGRRVQDYLGVGPLVAEVNKRLPEFQKATWGFAPGQTGDVLSPIRNPRRDSLIPAGLDLEEQENYRRDLQTHFVPRAQGGEALAPDSNIWYFTGRHRALTDICKWLSAKQPSPRLLVVTGRPGAGKSGLLGRLLTLADPRYRIKILSKASLPEQTIPPQRAFDTAIHLRERQVREVADMLVAAIGLPELEAKLRDDELGTVLAQSLAQRARCCCLLFDALDEAARPNDMWRFLLKPLSAVSNVRLIVGSRPLFEWGTATRIDLSDPLYLDDTHIQDYVERRLLAEEEPLKWTPYRRNPALARQVAEAVAARADGIFLVARIVSRLLIEAEAPVDTAAPDWKERIPRNVREAFDEYLERFGELNEKVRDVLLPLAYAEGQGLPWESIWAPLASALSGRQYGDSDIRQILERAGPFVIESQDGGRLCKSKSREKRTPADARL